MVGGAAAASLGSGGFVAFNSGGGGGGGDGAAAKADKTYTRAEVAKHDSLDKGVWVTYKDGVYDITSFIREHPGGADKIILAAGGAVDPFWRIYQSHFRSDFAAKVLAEMRIGALDASEKPTVVDTSDP